MRSAASIICGWSWRAMNRPEYSPSSAHGASSRRVSGCIADPATACTPALPRANEVTPGPSCSARKCAARSSANGDRQMFPVQTNSRRKPGLPGPVSIVAPLGVTLPAA